MLFSSWNQIFGSLTGYGILRLGLASVTLIATTGIFIPQSAVAQERQLSAKVSSQLPVVRSTALDPSINVPWSKPVRILDPFEGEYVGIFDKNYFYKRLFNDNVRVQVVSLWQRDSVRFLLAYSDRDCNIGGSFFSRPHIGRDCVTNSGALKLTNLWLKIGDRVFRLQGENSQFAVNPELATALKNAPNGNISIRLLTENGETVDSEIGKGTVQAWKTIY